MIFLFKNKLIILKLQFITYINKWYWHTSVQNVEYLYKNLKLYCKSKSLFLTDNTDYCILIHNRFFFFFFFFEITGNSICVSIWKPVSSLWLKLCCLNINLILFQWNFWNTLENLVRDKNIFPQIFTERIRRIIQIIYLIILFLRKSAWKFCGHLREILSGKFCHVHRCKVLLMILTCPFRLRKVIWKKSYWFN